MDLGLGTVLQVGGGLVNARGEMKANAKRKAMAKRLGWKIENLGDLSKPMEEALLEGYQPGGDIRTGIVGAHLAPLALKTKQSADAARSGGYRYGGSQHGAAARTLADAKIGELMGHVQGSQIGGAKADRNLTAMHLAREGADPLRYKALPENESAYMAGVLSGAGAGMSSGSSELEY